MTIIGGYVVVMSRCYGLEAYIAALLVLDANQSERTVLPHTGRDAQLAILVAATGVDLARGSQGHTVVPAESHLFDLEGDFDLDESGLLGGGLVIERQLSGLVVAVDQYLVTLAGEVVRLAVEGGQLVGGQVALLLGGEGVLSLQVLFRLERSPLIHLILCLYTYRR